MFLLRYGVNCDWCELLGGSKDEEVGSHLDVKCDVLSLGLQRDESAVGGDGEVDVFPIKALASDVFCLVEEDVGAVVGDCKVDLGETWEDDFGQKLVFTDDGKINVWDAAVDLREIEISGGALVNGDVWTKLF